MDHDTQNWWEIAIERNRAALMPIVAALFFMAGLDGGGAETLPRRVCRRILRVLSPAETAVRRLIMIAAHGLVVTVRMPAAPRHVPWWAVKKPGPAAARPASSRTARPASSPLVIAATGPRAAKPKGIPAHEFRRRFGLANAGPLPEAPAAPGPGDQPGRIPAFALFDPLKRFDCGPRARHGALTPRVTNILAHEGPLSALPENFGAAPDAEIGAVRLCRRVAALKAALDDIDGEAIRLARREARARQARQTGGNVRLRRFSPMRVGWPPGWRRRPIHAIDQILRECDTLARNLPDRETDTS